MPYSDHRHIRTCTTIAPLVLPHEFYCRERSAREVSFQKDLADKLTISFSHKKRANKARNESQTKSNSQYSIRDQKKKLLDNSSKRYSNLNIPKLNSRNELVQCEKQEFHPLSKERRDNVNLVNAHNHICREEEVLTSDICDLVDEIKSILHSDTFVNELLEQDLVEEVR